MTVHPSDSLPTHGTSLITKTAAHLWRNKRVRWVIAVILDLAIFYTAWQILTATGLLPSRYFPSANEVALRIGTMLIAPDFWVTIGNTLQSWGVGLIISGVAGTVIGILLGSSERVYRFCRVTIEMLRPVPPVVILPLVLLLLGVTLHMKVLLVVQGTFWIVLLQAVYGVRGVDSVMLETAQAYGMSRVRRFFSVQLPGSLPFIVTGIRIAAIVSLIVSIIAELVGGAPGLGNEILKALTIGDDQTMYALILLTGVLGVAITAAFSMLERIVLFWHPSQRKVSR